MSTAPKYSKDGRVAFYADKHEYFLDGSKKLTSVTTLIDRYCEQFDAPKQSKLYAAKHGLDAAEVAAGWKKENDLSVEQGQDTHDLLEHFHHTGFVPEPKDCKWPKQIQAIRFIQDYFLSGRLISLESEYICYNEKIASQIDNISRNPGGQNFILDYKTNKRIEMYSYGQRRMRHPFSRYMDCNFYHYSLQTKLYKLLSVEYPITETFIVHFDVDCYKIIKPADVEVPEWLIRD